MSAIKEIISGQFADIAEQVGEQLRQVEIPCAVCRLDPDPTAAPRRAVTAVSGTPVCVPHGRQLLLAVSGIELLERGSYGDDADRPTVETVP